jgi:hypothetical protein
MGVLQSLTGIRLQLREIADEHSASPLKNHLQDRTRHRRAA